MTDTHTLSDRYVAAAVRHVPAGERADLELELRGSIGDALDARLAAGEDPASAETAVLTDLGDPALLAYGYTGRPQHLHGPTVFHEWWRLLRLLLCVVVPIIVGVKVVAAVLEDEATPAILGGALGAGYGVALLICFWTTLVFAVIERTVPGGTRDMDPWTLDDLPEIVEQRVTIGETAFWLVTIGLTVAAIIWQRGSTLVTAGGEPVAILEPDNWSFWWPFLIGVLLAEAVLAVAVLRRGVWTPPLLGAYVVLELAFALPVLWLLSQDRVLNPEFISRLDWDQVEDPGGVLAAILAVSVVAITIWDIGEKSIQVWRARRSAGPNGSSAAALPGT